MKKVFEKILQANGLTLEDFKRIEYLKLTKEGYQPLVFEYLGTFNGFNNYSVSHYYVQNGDIMYDPDMQFLEFGDQFIPYTYQLDSLGVFHKAIEIRGGCMLKNAAMMKDMDSFATIWAKNIEVQGFVTAEITFPPDYEAEALV